MRALNSQTGALLWSAECRGEVWGAPMLANGVVCVGTAQELLAYNAATGALVCSSQISANMASMSSPAVVNGRVYTGSGDNRVIVLSLP